MDARLLIAPLVCAAAIAAPRPEPIMPLSEVKPGMTGVWRTCVAGTTVTSFPMRVVGLQPNIIYPGESVILCEALDAQNKHSGPVAGMSGSPVYIKGRIVGAYAYGSTAQKDQALFMATPIELMLKMGTLPRTAPVQGFSLPSPGNEGDESSLTPLFVSGLGPRALALMDQRFRSLGMRTYAAGSVAGAARRCAELKPGSPVAGVILHGDIAAAAVGTVTYRDENTIYAFGHPFTRSGAIEMPMAGAEMLAVSHSVSRSFKVGNIGPIVGTIQQDRSPAVVGTIGRMPAMMDIRVRSRHPVLGEREYVCKGIRHRELSAEAVLTAVLDPLMQGLDAIGPRTVRYALTFTLDSGETIGITNVAADSSANMMIAMSALSVMGECLSAPYVTVGVRSCSVDLSFSEELRKAEITRAWVSATTVSAGSSFDVALELQPFKGSRSIRTVPVHVPAETEPGTYSVAVCDADRADSIDGSMASRATTLPGLVRTLATMRTSDRVYVKLLGTSAGLVIEGAAMPGLPPSALMRWRSDAAKPLAETTLAESELPLDAVVHGSHQLSITVK